MRYTLILLPLLFLLSCSTTAPLEYVIDDNKFVPEGIAYSKKNDAFYLTSVAKSKILEVDRKTGRQRDFIGEHDGYAPGAGIYVDDIQNRLHALGGYYMNEDSLSSLYTFDINTKKLIKRYSIIDDREHFLNDMVLDNTGNIYATDSKDSSVYILRRDNDQLELFFRSEEITFPNGIAISEDNSKLYIASIPKGVRILDLSTMVILNAADSLGVSQGIDGLEFYNDHLYAVQNSVGANSFNFRKLILNKSQDAIIDVEVIDSHSSALDVPLTFCFEGHNAVVIGNSNLQYLNQETFTFKNSDTIPQSKLLVYPIK